MLVMIKTGRKEINIFQNLFGVYKRFIYLRPHYGGHSSVG
jgi:hypothetical protein